MEEVQVLAYQHLAEDMHHMTNDKVLSLSHIIGGRSQPTKRYDFHPFPLCWPFLLCLRLSCSFFSSFIQNFPLRLG